MIRSISVNTVLIITYFDEKQKQRMEILILDVNVRAYL